VIAVTALRWREIRDSVAQLVFGPVKDTDLQM
jgi:hypothetical protein